MRERARPRDAVADPPRGGGDAPLDDGAEVSPTGSRGKKPEGKRPHVSTVLIGNLGEWAHGAKARLVFEDGTVVERRIPDSARWVRYRVTWKSPLAHAVVDPDLANPWDWNRLNDSKVLGTGTGAADTLGGRAAFKYGGWAAALAAVWTQILWALA